MVPFASSWGRFRFAVFASSAFGRRASLTYIPPNFVFHAKKVALSIPCSRQTMAVFALASYSRRISINGSSLNFNLFIRPILLLDHIPVPHSEGFGCHGRYSSRKP